MPGSSPVFAQIMSALHPQAFARCVECFPPPRRPRALSAYDHFLALCFAQLTGAKGCAILSPDSTRAPPAATKRVSAPG